MEIFYVMDIVYVVCGYIAISYFFTWVLMSCIDKVGYNKTGLWIMWHVLNIVYTLVLWWLYA